MRKACFIASPHLRTRRQILLVKLQLTGSSKLPNHLDLMGNAPMHFVSCSPRARCSCMYSCFCMLYKSQGWALHRATAQPRVLVGSELCMQHQKST